MTPEELEKVQDKFTWAGRYADDIITHLAQVEEIGRWTRSDDSTDNRDRRRGLRDAADDASSARRELDEILEIQPKLTPKFAALRDGLNMLDDQCTKLSETVDDTMGESQEFTSAVWKLQAHADELVAELNRLREEVQPAL